MTMMPPPRSPRAPREKRAIPEGRFDYDSIGAKAGEVRAVADRIRQKLKTFVRGAVEIGEALLEVKALLQHGSFGSWVRAEFAWTERTARNYMSIAKRFGSKTELISDLPIWTTAAFRLAAPSVSDKARKLAIKRARAGETITVKIAKSIIAMTRDEKNIEPAPAEKVNPRLERFVIRYLDRCFESGLPAVVEKLRELTAMAEQRLADATSRDKPASATVQEMSTNRPVLVVAACGDASIN